MLQEGPVKQMGGGVAIYVSTKIQGVRMDAIGHFQEASWCNLIIGWEQLGFRGGLS